MKPLFSTEMHASNGGRNGVATSPQGDLELTMSLPKLLGGTGEGTNPEQLFAAGYAACFSNAALHVAKTRSIQIDDIPVKAQIDLLGNPDGTFKLGAKLTVSVALPQADADALINEAHKVCPYSNAIRNNVDVELVVLGQ